MEKIRPKLNYIDIKFDVHDFVMVSGFHFIGTDLLLLANDTDD